MDILILLIPLSVALVLLIGAGFWWSVASGQFDDLEGPAHRILDDDDTNAAPSALAGCRRVCCGATSSFDLGQTSRGYAPLVSRVW